MKKKCENCYYYHTFLGAEYCSLDVGKKFWEERLKKYEIMCDRFILKNASHQEQMEYLRKQHEKQVKFDLWEEEEEEDDDPYMRSELSKSEISRLKRERKISIVKRKKFIDKYPILNPSPPKKVEKKLRKGSE